MSAQDFIVWVDTETTGIDANQNLLLELAIIITDNDLNIMHEQSFIIDHNIGEVLAKSNDYVQEMHRKNGLLEDVANNSIPKVSLLDLDMKLVEILTFFGIDKKGLLAGNSIHFDRSYIKEYLPSFNSQLDYRMLDVSAIAIAVNRGILDLPKPEKKYGHRALDDIKESIAELALYSKKDH